MSGKKPVQPQPPKLPRQQTTSSTSQAKNPPGQQLVPISASSIANRYVVSTIPKPNYHRPSQGYPSYCSALASPPLRQITPYTVEDPFGPIIPQKPSYQSKQSTSCYVKKPFVQHISYIEPHLVHITDPLALAMEILPNGWHFLPKSPGKNIRFYKSILIQEDSARIENIMNKKDPSQVLYHKFIIKGFVSCSDWGQHPSLLKNLTNTKGFTELQYSYYDYMDAFEKILFYQNQDFDHSWFIMFDKSFSSQIPSWFLKWWKMFGSIPQIFPEPLQDALSYVQNPLDKHVELCTP
nr:hypothetical protein CFP56_75275 [Quercus suber]